MVISQPQDMPISNNLFIIQLHDSCQQTMTFCALLKFSNIWIHCINYFTMNFIVYIKNKIPFISSNHYIVPTHLLTMMFCKYYQHAPLMTSKLYIPRTTIHTLRLYFKLILSNIINVDFQQHHKLTKSFSTYSHIFFFKENGSLLTYFVCTDLQLQTKPL